MSFKKNLISRVLLHIFAALLLIAILLFGTFRWLKSYTHHGEEYTVPALTGLSVDKALAIAGDNKLRIEVIDSVYDANYSPGAVVDQLPLANSKVKENRIVRLTINSEGPEKVAIPKLTDISFRQAKVLIEKYGLFVQNVSFEPSEYNDLVLKVMKDSVLLPEGEMIEKGSGVDLVVGHTYGNKKTFVPNLIGFTIEEARAVIADAKLNMGAFIYDPEINTPEDSVAAKIWRQAPLPTVKEIDMGASIDFWLTADSLKIDNAYKRDL